MFTAAKICLEKENARNICYRMSIFRENGLEKAMHALRHTKKAVRKSGPPQKREGLMPRPVFHAALLTQLVAVELADLAGSKGNIVNLEVVDKTVEAFVGLPCFRSYLAVTRSI